MSKLQFTVTEVRAAVALIDMGDGYTALGGNSLEVKVKVNVLARLTAEQQQRLLGRKFVVELDDPE